jgi:hypothetical protein
MPDNENAPADQRQGHYEMSSAAGQADRDAAALGSETTRVAESREDSTSAPDISSTDDYLTRAAQRASLDAYAELAQLSSRAPGEQLRGEAEDPADTSTSALERREISQNLENEARTRNDIGNTRINQDVGENYGMIVGLLQQTVRRIVDSHELRPKYIADCIEIFVDPLNINEARGIIGEHRVAVLVGPTGAGRHVSAIWLLNEIGNLQIREVRREPSDGFAIEDLLATRNTGWILDLRAEDDQVALSFGRALLASREVLEDANSYLTVTISARLWDIAKVGGEKLAVVLQPPPAIEIVRRRLVKGERPLSELEADQWLRQPDIIRHLDQLSPPEGVVWSEAIRNEHFTPLIQNNDGEAGVGQTEVDEIAEKVRNVIKARSNWRAELLNWHKNHQDSRRRNFLLAGAVLENASTEDVFTAAESLGQAFGEPRPKAPGLTGPGILELTSDVEAYLPDGETLRFSRFGYADAVLEYFWIDRMHLREPFIAWMANLPLSTAEATANVTADRIGQYVFRWSARRNSLNVLEKLITTWSRHRQLAAAAEELITAAGLDESLGKAMRDKLLSWAKDDEEVEPATKVAVARACGGPLGFMYPKMMLLRIGYLASTATPAITEAVKESVRSLWDLPSIRPRIRSEIANWCDSGNLTRRDVGRYTFAALALLMNTERGGPLLLFPAEHDEPGLISDSERSFFSQGWRSIFDEPRLSDDAVHAFCAWMDSALASAEAREAVLGVFISAVYGPGDEHFSDRRHVTLYNLLFRWEPASGEINSRTAMRDELLQEVRALDPLRQPMPPEKSSAWDA